MNQIEICTKLFKKDLIKVLARVGLDRFIPWTVAGRYYAAGLMVLFVVLGKVGLGMLLFAAVDTAAVTWTWLALRSVYPK